MLKFIKISILGLILLLGFDSIYGEVTEEQMAASTKIMKDVCLPKYKTVTAEVAEKLSHGELPEDQNVKCYVNCLMELMGVMKKGKFNYAATMKQIEVLVPSNMKEDYANGVNACKDGAKGIKDHCEAAYAILRCMESNMKHFYFP